MTRTMICIVCPKGCAMEVTTPDPGEATAAETSEVGVRATEGLRVEGAGCKRGIEYASREIVDPRRVLTSTVRTTSRSRRRLAVRSAGPIPLPLLEKAARSLDGIVVSPPLACGSVLSADWLGLGVDLVAADDLE